jgi:hypothetical protein
MALPARRAKLGVQNVTSKNMTEEFFTGLDIPDDYLLKAEI